MRRLILLVLALLAAATGVDSAAQTRREAERRRSENHERQFKIRFEAESAEFGRTVVSLATRAAELGLKEEMQALWKRLEDLDPNSAGQTPPVTANTRGPDADIATFNRDRERSFREHADSLMTLAQLCYRAGLIGRSYDMVWEATRYNPDHRTARRLLGQVNYEDEWISVYDASMLRRGMVFTEEYGWVPRRDLPRYQEGLLPLGNRWLPREQVEQVRSTWAHAWEYETQHYRIRTNAHLKDAVVFGQYLEENYSLFYRVFLGYFSSKSQSEMLFGVNQPKEKLQVNYFADRADYLRLIGEYASGTLGVYTHRDKTAHFFKTDWNTNLRVLKHEATHQLFDASRRTTWSRHGVWVIEGVATYMETCHRRDGRIVTEGANAPWVRSFSQILMASREVPISHFDGLGTYSAFQNVSVGYPQAASLTYYLMEFEDGKYRERFVDYVSAFYSGRVGRNATLETFIGVPYAEMDEEFHRFILGDERYAEKLRRQGEKEQKEEMEIIIE